ncbi:MULTISPECIES: MacB family efflux pump subunit [Rhodopseudomonas]|uniref:Pyoverdine export ATP-binding/permease protein PvdT n=1 Tax=Rhodopseudomonas palustris TaxID=1076 RepID=A0A0D7EEN4_RHOPL|nr:MULTISPECIES: MacB family efflux pump subunit [Rhodopseudomonas]KIZ39249.1 macrolide transporter [Rhodopseudomonas palustris]MDF3814350.1 MacB family efflux pump subunit [Rhodopseudomonas sp. BAL398]WOK18046.1 MacB family efflux pump subunit [Rhodopseudomonas sp. BAL398]
MARSTIVLRGLRREFASGDATVVALRDLDLTIEPGEMVAIMGASGSGKSTLMNILGCLDRPSSGSYQIAGRETSSLDADQLAALRREHFGFIFQRYHLLPELTALGNVEIPAIYAGQASEQRRDRAAHLLARLGITDRASHRPNQLSGGQQQRVSIARALMNGADVILADEPTGALDRRSGDEVLRILDELHADGKTVIIVTHDAAVAARAKRVIELSDGVVISDRATSTDAPAPRSAAAPAPARTRRPWQSRLDRIAEAFRMAMLAMAAHRLRTFLTMLGIIIGIASVVFIIAVGDAAKRKVLTDISSLGTNTIEIFPGKDLGDVRSSKIKTLVLADARALALQPYVDGVTPTVSTSTTLRHGPLEANALVNGVGAQYFAVKGTKLSTGQFFDETDLRDISQDVVIDEKTRQTFFADDPDGPIGKVILIGRVPCRIVGVTQQQQAGFGSSQNLSVYLPYTTVQARFLGNSTLRSIVVKVDDKVATKAAEQDVTRLLTLRHRLKDFVILNTDDIRKTITSTTATLTLMIAAIAVISLVVGGIGVMNIMLVSVSERIGEIGVRMAVGARRSDILQQFLIEAVMVCLIGGGLGVGIAFSLAALFNLLVPAFPLSLSGGSIAAAFICSTGIGVVFGYLPARQASFLDPLAALSRD